MKELPVVFDFNVGDKGGYMSVGLRPDCKTWEVAYTNNCGWKSGVLNHHYLFKDSDYKKWLYQQNCSWFEDGHQCQNNVIQGHHEPPKQRGGREDDLYFGRMVMLCSKHHDIRTANLTNVQEEEKMLFIAQRILPAQFLSDLTGKDVWV